MYLVLELLGTIAFAISGAMVGVKKKMDLLGVVVLGMTTAVGGGIIRDLIIGKTPPIAFEEPIYAIVALIVSLIVFVPAVRNNIDTDNMFICFVDAIGLGVFTVVGVKTGLEYNNIFLTIFLGTITGVGGGVLRDIFANQTPNIFVRHFYAVASIIGACLCTLSANYLPENIAMVISIILIVLLRMLAAKYKWKLPKVK